MKKVEIEILSYKEESLLSTTTTSTSNQFVYNYDFNSNPFGAVVQGSDDGEVMKSNHAMQNVWRGFWTDGSGHYNGIPEFAPFRNANNKAEFSTYDTTLNHWGLSSIYQKITGLTIGNTYVVKVDVDSVPPGITLGNCFISVGIWNTAGTMNANCITQNNAVNICEVGVNAGNNEEGWGGGTVNPIIITTGVLSYTFVAQHTSGILSVGVSAQNPNIGSSLVLNSIEVGTTTTTTTQHWGQDLSKALVGKLDLTDSENFPLAMSFAVSDGKNLESIFGDYSKSFQVPATKNNQKLLGFIDNPITTDRKEVIQKHPCRVIVDGVEMMNGKLKVIGSSQKRKADFYECVFYGGNADWGSMLKDRRMCDVEFVLGDGLTNPLNTGRLKYGYMFFQASWGASSSSSDIVYPLVSYGDFYPTGSGGYVNRWDAGDPSQDWRYWVYVRNTLEYIFKATGYRIESTFLSQLWVGKLIYNLNWGRNEVEAINEQYSLRYIGTPGGSNVTNLVIESAGASGTSFPCGALPCNDWNPETQFAFSPGIQLPTRVSDTYSQYSQDGYSGVADGKITIAKDGQAKFSCKFSYVGWYYPVTNAFFQGYAIVRIRKKDFATSITTTIATNTPGWHCWGYSCSTGDIATWSESLESLWTPVNVGDQIWFETSCDGTCAPACSNNTPATWRWILIDNNGGNDEASFIQMDFDGSKISIDNELNVADTLPCDITQSTFLKAIAHMFNLYFYTDVQKKIVYIEPFTEFFTRTNTLNWTPKIDWSKSIVDKYQIGLKREILFKYKDDSNDKYLEYLNEKVLQRPGFYEYYEVLGDKFNEGLMTFENPLFCPTREEFDKDCGGAGTNDSVRIPVYEKEPVAFGTGMSPFPFRPDKAVFKPHILYWDGFVQDGSVQQANHKWFYEHSGGLQTSSSTYPRAVFVDTMQTNTSFTSRINLSYNDEVHNDGSIMKGLFTSYWKDMIEQNKLNPRIRSVYINLKLTDILGIDMSKLVYLDESWWRINKIVDFNPAKNETTKVELMQWFDVGGFNPLTTNAPSVEGLSSTSSMRLSRNVPSRNELGMNENDILEFGSGGVFVREEGERGSQAILPVLMLDRSGNFHQVIRTTSKEDVIEEGLDELFEGDY